jgi:hypothetical protein
LETTRLIVSLSHLALTLSRFPSSDLNRHSSKATTLTSSEHTLKRPSTRRNAKNRLCERCVCVSVVIQLRKFFVLISCGVVSLTALWPRQILLSLPESQTIARLELPTNLQTSIFIPFRFPRENYLKSASSPFKVKISQTRQWWL